MRLPLPDPAAVPIGAPAPATRLHGLAPLDRAAIPRDTVELARFLLGKIVVRELGRRVRSGRIVETEAYLPTDPACHAFRGMTARNRSLFLDAGHAYVYLCYGTSFMLNVSSQAAALDIDRRHDGLDLCRRGTLWLADDGAPAGIIGESVRIGLTKAAHARLRYFVAGNGYLSGPRSLNGFQRR